MNEIAQNFTTRAKVLDEEIVRGRAGAGNIKAFRLRSMSTLHLELLGPFVHVAWPFPSMLKNLFFYFFLMIPKSRASLDLGVTRTFMDLVGIMKIFVCG